MAAQNNADVLALQLEKVHKKVPVLFDINDTFYSQAEKRPVDIISSRDMRIPLEMHPGGYFGQYNPDGGDLGRGSAPDYDKAVISTVDFRYALEWTKKAEWATNKDVKAVINVFQQNLAKSMPRFRNQMDAMCMTSGNGVLGTVESFSTGGGTDTAVLSNDFGVKLLMYGQKINVYSSNLSTQRTTPGSEPEITYRDVPSRTIKFAAVAGLQNGDVIVIEGVSGASPTSLLGVPYHVNNASTGSWLGFTRSSTPEVRATRVNAAGAAFTLPFPRLAINLMMDRIETNGNNKALSVRAWMHPCQVQAYENLGMIVSEIHKTVKDEGLNRYFGNGRGEGMQMAGAPVSSHYKWNKKRIDFLHMEYWGRAEMVPPGFYTSDGRRLFEVRGSSGGVVTSTLMYLVSSWNLFTSNPLTNSYIDDLAIPSGY